MASKIIGIAGGTASGKSTAAERLFSLLPAGQAVVIVMDRYYLNQDHLTPERRSKVNYDHPSSFDLASLLTNVVELRSGKPAQLPIYDFCTHTRKSNKDLASPASTIIIEGILSFHMKEMRDLYDLKIFIDAPSDLRLKRRMERDIRERGRTQESVLRQWNDTVSPMHEEFCEPTKKYADIVLDGRSFADPELTNILNRLGIQP